MSTIYISPTGNDATGDGSSGNPYKTLTKGYASAFSGDTVQMSSGTFDLADEATGYVLFNANKNITFKGEGKSVTSIVSTASKSYTFYIRYVFNSNIVFEDVEIQTNANSMFYHFQSDITGDQHSANLYINSARLEMTGGSGKLIANTAGTYTGEASEFVLTDCSINTSNFSGYVFYLGDATFSNFILDTCTFDEIDSNTIAVLNAATTVKIDSIELKNTSFNKDTSSTPFIVASTATVKSFVVSNDSDLRTSSGNYLFDIKGVTESLGIIDSECYTDGLDTMLDFQHVNKISFKGSNLYMTSCPGGGSITHIRYGANTINVDNCIMERDGDSYVFAIGTDGVSATSDYYSVVITRSTFNDKSTDGCHGVLLGEGVKNALVTGCKITSPKYNCSVNIGLVCKADDSIISFNQIISERCLYFKNGQRNTAFNNTLIAHGTLASSCCLQIANVEDSDTTYESNYNKIYNNVMYAVGARAEIVISDTGTTSPQAKTNKTYCDYNLMYGGEVHILNVNASNTEYTFAQASTFWDGDIFPDNEFNSLNENPIFKDPANGDYTVLNPHAEGMGAGSGLKAVSSASGLDWLNGY